MAESERGDARLLRDLAALGRLTSRDGGSARARLEAQLGAEQTGLLVGALGSSRGRHSRRSRPAASA